MSDDRVLQFDMIVPIKPRGQGRPRFDPRSSRAFTPKQTRDYVETIRARAIEMWGDRSPLAGAVWMRIDANFLLPKQAKNRVHHTQKPDFDNIAKAIADALLPLWTKRTIDGVKHRVCTWGGVIEDDCLIVEATIRKRWSIEAPSVRVTIWSEA